MARPSPAGQALAPWACEAAIAVIGSPPLMKPAEPATDRIAFAVAALASVWFLFAAAWGLFAIPGGGHLGSGSAGNVMAAEQILRWHIVYPAWDWYTGTVPPKGDYICHHPFGQYWVPAVFLLVFGHRDFVVRLPAVLMSTAIPPLLYGIAKEKWGRPAGAVAAAAYVVVPIAVGFASFTNLETFCIFGSLLFFWGHTRHAATGRGRYLGASLVGLAFACSGDWCGYLLVAPTLVWAFVRACVLPGRLTPRLRFEPYLRWWALSTAVVLGTLVLWLGLFFRANRIDDWVGSAQARGGGSALTLQAVLDARKAWLDFSFTPVAIVLGKIAAPVALLRLLALREDEETYSLGLLFGGGVQYLVFKQGADVHIFWPHYFAPYYALALAQLARTIAAVPAWVVRRLAPPYAAPAIATITLLVGLAPSLAMARDGVASLWVWRRTGGRYDDNGTLIRSHVDLLEVLRVVVMPRVARGTRLDAHPSAAFGWEHVWTYQGTANQAADPQPGVDMSAHPFWIARGSGLSTEEQKRFAAKAHVRVYGDTWVVDQREGPAPLDAYSLNEREPSFFEWLLTHPTERVLTPGARPDPWLTWEWRTHLGQDAPLPAGQPRTLDELRIAHNLAVARGDAKLARTWRDRIDAQIDRTLTVEFDRFVRLVGVRVLDGVEPRIESWFEVIGQTPGDCTWAVRSTIVSRAPFSLIAPDPTDRQMAFAPSLATGLWRPGFLYKTEISMNHRIGVERYLGSWAPNGPQQAPRRPDGGETTLAIAQ